MHGEYAYVCLACALVCAQGCENMSVHMTLWVVGGLCLCVPDMCMCG